MRKGLPHLKFHPLGLTLAQRKMINGFNMDNNKLKTD